MSELLKYLVEWLKANRIGREVLLFSAIFGVLFSIFEYLIKNPEAANALKDYRLQSATVTIISFWLASLCWRFAKYRFLRVFAAITFVGIGAVGTVWIINSHRIDQWTIRILFDESVLISPDEMTRLARILQSPLFSVEIRDEPIVGATAQPGNITDKEAKSALDKDMYERHPEKLFTMLVTAKNLSDSKWSNLLSISWPNSAVVSIWGVGQTNNISEVTVRRYIATSAVLEGLVSRALSYKKTILEDRDPTTYKGCLHDFHRTRQTYIHQAQSPTFCDLEANSIKAIFGEPTLKTANQIFARIAASK